MAEENALVTKVRAFEALVSAENRVQTLVKLLPEEIDVKRFLQLLVIAASRTPKILECSQFSIVRAMYTAATAGLEIDGVEGHLVPFKGSVEFVPGYQGLLKRMYDHEAVAAITCEVVHQSDEFEYVAGTAPRIEHSPEIDDDPGELRAVYAIAHMRSGSPVTVVLSKAEVEKVMKSSASAGKSDSPWRQWPEEMWKKTALRRLSKLVPKSKRGSFASQLLDDPSPESRPPLPVEVDAPREAIEGAQAGPESEGAPETSQDGAGEEISPGPAQRAEPEEKPAKGKQQRAEGKKGKEEPQKAAEPEPQAGARVGPSPEEVQQAMEEPEPRELPDDLAAAAKDAGIPLNAPWLVYAQDGDFEAVDAEQVDGLRALIAERKPTDPRKWISTILGHPIESAKALVVGEYWHVMRVSVPERLPEDRRQRTVTPDDPAESLFDE